MVKKKKAKKTTKKIVKKVIKKTVNTTKKIVKKVAKKVTTKSVKQGGQTKKAVKAKNPIIKKKKVAVTKFVKQSVGVKKTATKKRGKKVLVIAVGDRCFRVNYGSALRDLLELRDTLRDINEEQFNHHVNEIRNDFADWVGDVLEDKKTALHIIKTKTINSMLKVVEKALKDYQV